MPLEKAYVVMEAVRSGRGRVSYSPRYAARDKADAAALRDALSEATGLPAAIGEIEMYDRPRGDGDPR